MDKLFTNLSIIYLIYTITFDAKREIRILQLRSAAIERVSAYIELVLN